MQTMFTIIGGLLCIIGQCEGNTPMMYFGFGLWLPCALMIAIESYKKESEYEDEEVDR